MNVLARAFGREARYIRLAVLLALLVLVTDTAFVRNRAYHTSQDTADRLDYPRMAQVVDAVLAAVRHEAGQRSRR